MAAHTLEQKPKCGTSLLSLRGDVVTFELRSSHDLCGEAFLRTNLGRARQTRDEILEAVEQGTEVRGWAWHDVLMEQIAPGHWSVTLPLIEAGIFEAKAFVMPSDSSRPIWPDGGNVDIKVCSENTVCRNTIYTAFPRQFHQTREGYDASIMLNPDILSAMDAAGYTVIPPSGTFRDLSSRLDFLIGELGFRIIQLLPIHPVPTMFARMGRFGSPFASLDFFGVDPAMAEFDPKATPLDQFVELTDAIHAREGFVFIDLPANHTGWASQLQIHHPEWFEKNADGSFLSPGAWGVVWEDLCQLDYDRSELWQYMADVFLFWCRLGVDGFRCDAGYMIPAGAWQYIVAKVRCEYPSTVFLLEGLGGPDVITRELLADVGLDWAYSELFQNYSKGEIEAYLPSAIDISTRHGALVCFAETHDNNRLASTSHAFASMRTALCALFSPQGACGLTNGAEWFATEKFDVHGSTHLNWGAMPNQSTLLKRLHRVLEQHSAFHAGAEMRLVSCNHPNVVAILRVGRGGDEALVAVNLDTENEANTIAAIPGSGLSSAEAAVDCITGEYVRISSAKEGIGFTLAPGRALALVKAHSVSDAGPDTAGTFGVPEAVCKQVRRAKALELAVHCGMNGDVSRLDVESLAIELKRDPIKAVQTIAEPATVHVVEWLLGEDERRCVPVSTGSVVVARSSCAFRIELSRGDRRVATEKSFAVDDSSHVAIIVVPSFWQAGPYRIIAVAYRSSGSERVTGRMLVAADLLNQPVETVLRGSEMRRTDACGLGTNERGSMMLARAAWGTVASKYDALLAANLHAEVPVERTILLPRCKGWLVYRDFSQTIDMGCQTAFRTDGERLLQWQFLIPTGLGKHCKLLIEAELAKTENRTDIRITRLEDDPNETGFLEEHDPVELILRPELECRSFHELTKAFLGPEHTFPSATRAMEGAFTFAQGDCRLDVTISRGRFSWEPEWEYCVRYPVEEERGLECEGDLFSPGYFSAQLLGGDTVVLTASADSAGERSPAAVVPRLDLPEHLPLDLLLCKSMAQFVVRRNSNRTVIAGYPWFLDWGRDTLICLRGMIAGGMHSESRDILCEFARFEDKGTLPNMIRGDDHSNRDTSDAPLWFLVAMSDYLRMTREERILETDCNGRPMRDILVSIGRSYRSGTPNGIGMDAGTGLIYSPSHFTWMDTNFPAGTPREGYPIEIQALWHAGLQLLSELCPDDDWGELATQVRNSIHRLYVLPEEQGGGLSDCLHAERGTSADEARRDDACRPNQLFAVTLGAVRDVSLMRSIVSSCAKLLVPGAIRSLADRSVAYHLPVLRDGVLLNDPTAPYWGIYTGDEDTRRKPAYHNGTAWTWVFPSYAEALAMAWGKESLGTTRALLSSGIPLLREGCVGQIPELCDGNAPHAQKGCAAQAWGVTEFLRVLRGLEADSAS